VNLADTSDTILFKSLEELAALNYTHFFGPRQPPFDVTTSESLVAREVSFPERTSLFFPQEPVAFKVECNFQEMRAPYAQDAVKIVPLILPIICDERNLRADLLLA
jgi:hypothetical protein